MRFALPILILSLLPLTLSQETTSTVIDLLSENVEFSYFLRILQRNQLVPLLNQLENITLAAPVNSAFINHFKNSDCKREISDCINTFNIELDQYLINQVVNSSCNGIHIFKSIDEQPTLVNITEEYFEINGKSVVEPDLFAETQNSYVQGLEGLFNIKSNSEVLDGIEEANIFVNLLNETDISNKTILVPLDTSFDFKHYELKYLYSDYGNEDRALITNSLLIDDIYGGDINLTTFDENYYQVEISSEKEGEIFLINDTVSIDSNIISKDSIFHVFNNDSLVKQIEFNAKKVLIGLDASSFVDELVLQKLESLITNNSIHQTIFYSKDSNFQIYSKSSNLYHFVDETIENLSDAKPLYDTKFCNEKKFGTNCQRIKIDEISEDTFMLNNNILIEEGPYKVGNSVIYLTDDNLRTPGDLISSVNPVFHCSTAVGYLSNLKLHKLPNNSKGYTLFLPCFNSFDDYLLTFNYLENNITALEIIMKNLIVEGLVYSDFNEDSIELTNLNNENVNISSIISSKDNISLQFDNIPIDMRKNSDILFNQGVIHPINKLIVPPSIKISLLDIISSSDATQFIELVSQFPDLNAILTSSNYSILLPSAYSLSRFPFTNNTLEQFLKLHIIPESSLESLYNCEDDIQTLNPKVNLTCTNISTRSTILQIKDGSDNGVRILSKGCTGQSGFSCVYSIDKAIELGWISDHYHISLPGIAIGLGVLLGSVSMIFVLGCCMIFVLKNQKSKEVIIQEEENIEENNESEESPNESTSLLVNNFENGYSANTNIDPILVKKKKVGFNL